MFSPATWQELAETVNQQENAEATNRPIIETNSGYAKFLYRLIPKRNSKKGVSLGIRTRGRGVYLSYEYDPRGRTSSGRVSSVMGPIVAMIFQITPYEDFSFDSY